MSDVPFDPSAAADLGGQQQPSEEEIRAYLSQLREAPVDQVLAEVANALLNAAQVKVGRRDGRLLIDALGAMTDAVRGHAAEELTSQLDEALQQLRMAQVEGEQQLAQAAAKGENEAGDLSTDPAGAEDGSEPSDQQPQQAPPQQPSQGGSAASRLWVPGR
ncbi:MAG: hypothetical protein EA340_08545 [Nitriliruptor sp.]|nr:MAG: hypothetical protein EA340_08545 [Nitriliruptor sp.]